MALVGEVIDFQVFGNSKSVLKVYLKINEFYKLKSIYFKSNIGQKNDVKRRKEGRKPNRKRKFEWEKEKE